MLIPLLIAQAASAGSVPFMRSPDIFGDRVVYTCEGDLWLGDLKSGKAIRITRDVGLEFDARFSPDGTMIAYSGELDGIREIYVMPVAGGAPKRLTYLNEFADMADWQDNRTVVFRARNYPAATAPTLFSVDVSGTEPKRLPLEFASQASFAPDGNRFAFTRYQRFTNAWFRYQGGLKNPIWIGDLRAKRFKQVYEGRGSAEFPFWVRDRIYFATYLGGDFSLSSVREDGSAYRRETGPSDFEIRYVQGDGNAVIYEKGLGVEVFYPSSGKVSPVSFEMVSDLLHTRPFLVPAETAVQSWSIGPTGKRILVETRGQIVSLAARDGDARVLVANDGVRYRSPVYSPDGKKIAYFGDESGEMQLYVADADGQNPRQQTRGMKRQLKRIFWSPDSKIVGYTTNSREMRLVDLATGSDTLVQKGGGWGWDAPNASFSPDSRWLAYAQVDLWTNLGTIALYEIGTGRKTVVGVGQVDDMWPTFSPDGKYLAFLSRRNLAPVWDPIQNHLNLRNDVKVYLLTLSADTPSPVFARAEDEGQDPVKEEPKPFRIDLEGLYGRFVEVPLEPANYTALDFAGDRLLVLDGGDEPRLRYYDLKARKAGTLVSGPGGFDVSRDGKKVLYGSGANLRIVDASADAAAGERVSFGGLQIRIDPRAEWRQMFWDAWRLLRDYFYVANMHGADWDAVGKKYSALLPSVRSRDELDQLIRWMQGELAISHAFLGAGDVRSLVRPARPSFLGADLEPSGGYYRIKKIFRGGDFQESERSPLAAPGLAIKEGDYLIEVGGRPAKEGTPWREALLGRAGQLVTVKVNSSPTEVGARAVQIRPAPNETRMRWWDWVYSRREYVNRVSGGRIAYVYLRAMVQDDMADFIRQYYPQRGKEALIMDTRFNTGGNVSDQIITVLKQTGMAFWNQRDADVPWTRQSDFFPGPMVCLQNEFNYSDGEEFPFYFKAMKLGPVIGRRTRGGEVGSDPGWPLADGGTVSVPNYGMFTPDGKWVIEGTGVEPDIEVLSDPNAWAQGKDPQLDKAIEYLLDQLKKGPYKKPTIPPDPVRIGKSGGR